MNELKELLEYINGFPLLSNSMTDIKNKVIFLIDKRNISEKQFTEKDLVDFGNYLLSNKRNKSVIKNKKEVHQEDIANVFPDIEISK